MEEAGGAELGLPGQHHHAPRLALSLADFDLIRRLGDGSFAQVVEVRHRASGRVYALKAVDKHLVLRHKQAHYIRAERALLDQLAHPGIVRLHFTFQDAASLYLGLELCPNGELYDQIQRKGKLALDEATFYASEIVDILVYLREQRVVHRDLKPENLLLDADGHLVLTDFGSAKHLDAPAAPACPAGAGRGKDLHAGRRSSSLVGSADYVSPEVSFSAVCRAAQTLRNEPVGPEADLWALGCILYQMLVGKAPFRAASEYLTFERIASGKLRIPPGVDAHAADAIKRLLRPEPAKRLGAGRRGLPDLMSHAFFRGVDWQRVREQTPPELVPPPPGNDDAEDLNWEFTSMLSALPIQYSYSDSAPDLLPGSGAGRAAAEDGAPAGARPAHDGECRDLRGEAASASGSRAPGEGAQVCAAADEGSGEAALACASAGGGGLCRNGIAGAAGRGAPVLRAEATAVECGDARPPGCEGLQPGPPAGLLDIRCS